jgi:hypothetical protein
MSQLEKIFFLVYSDEYFVFWDSLISQYKTDNRLEVSDQFLEIVATHRTPPHTNNFACLRAKL